MAPQPNIVTALDIGSYMTRVVVAQIDPESEKPRVLGIGEVPTAGMRKGVIVDLEDVVSSIATALEQAERISGHEITSAYVSVNGAHVTAQESEGVIAVSRADGEIDEADVHRVIEAAQAVSLPQNTEVLHVIPKTFSVDNQSGIKDPVGMTGVRLEAKVHIILGSSSHIKNLTKAVYRAGIEIDELVFSSLVAADAVLTKRQRELGVVAIDVGEGTTGIVVYEEGDILYTSVLPVGGGHITNDIALDLKSPIEVAEKVKLEYGTALFRNIGEKEKMDLSTIDESEHGEFSKRRLARVIEARVEEIFSLVDKELKSIDRARKLPAGAVVTGGCAQLSGVVDVAKETLKLPTQIGFPIELPAALDQLDDPSYATCIGLLLWGVQDLGDKGASRSSFSVGDSVQRARQWFKSLLP